MNTPRHRGTGMHAQLVAHALLSILLPIALFGGLAFFFLTYHLDVIDTSFTRSRAALTENIARSDLVAQASSIARRIDLFLIERIMEARSWASSSAVIEAALEAHSIHVSEGLTEASAPEVEDRFRIDKSLNISPGANAYLRSQVAASPYFAEIFFTDRSGFNVALTNPTSDFIQSDEEWWQNAWTRGISVGEVKYDESAGAWSIDISVRIDEPHAKDPIGVMKTVLAIEPIQKIAEYTAQTVPGARVQIATGRGALIAETSSGNARERIMNPDIDLSEQGDEAVRAAFGSERAGFAADQDWLTAFARTGGRDTYASIVPRFGGFDWIAILQRPLADILEPITALRSIEGALRDWRWILAVAIGLMALLSTVLAVFLAVGAARRYTATMRAVRDVAERAVQGERMDPAEIERPEEIVRLNDAVSSLSRAFLAKPRA